MAGLSLTKLSDRLHQLQLITGRLAGQKVIKIFISKMETVIEEADETLFWLEMIDESDIMDAKNEIVTLAKETNELLSIFVASVKTVKNRLNKP